MVASVILILAAGVLLDNYAQRTRARTGNLLLVLARAKSSAIRAHLDERTADAGLLASNPEALLALDASAAPRRRADARQRLQRTVESMVRAYHYSIVVVADTALLAVASVGSAAIGPEVREAVSRAMRARREQPIAFHRSHEGLVGYGVAVPVFADADAASRIVGTVYVIFDERQWIAGTLRAAMPGSTSFESLLLQRDGDRALVVDASRLPDSVPRLSLHLALADTQLVASRSLFVPPEARIEGIDYRGTEVVAGVSRIRGTPWTVVSKLDLEEAEEPIRTLTELSVGLVALLIALLFLGWRALRSREERATVRTRARAAARSVDIVRTTMDGLVVLDAVGRFLEVNEATAAITGYSVDELHRLSLRDVKVVRSAGDPSDILARIRREGRVRFTSQWRRKDATVIDLDISATFREDADGDQVVAFVRDVTEARTTRRHLERLNHLYLFLHHASEALFAAKSRKEACDAVVRIAVTEGGFRLVWTGELDAQSGVVRPTCMYGAASEYVRQLDISTDPTSPTSQGPVAQSIRDRTPVVVNDFARDPRTAPWHELARTHELAAALSLPVIVDDVPIGAIVFYAGEAGFFEPDLVLLLSEVARMLALVVQAIDANENRVAEEQRRRHSEESFRAIFESSPLPMYVCDERSGRIDRVNRAFTGIFGYTHDDIPDQSILLERFYPDDVYRKLIRERFRRESGELSPEQTTVRAPDLAVRCKDGSDRSIQGFVTRVGSDLVIACVDLTELRANQQLVRNAQRIARMSTWVYDFRTGVMTLAADFYEALALERSESASAVPGLFALLSPDDRARAQRDFDGAVREHRLFEVTSRVQTRDGSERYLRDRIKAEYDHDDRPTRAVGSSQDVTDEVLRLHELETYRERLEERVAQRTAELARANAILETTDRRLKAMFAMSQKAAALDEAQILQLGVDEAVRLTASGAGYLHLISEDQQQIAVGRWATGTPEQCGASVEQHFPVGEAGVWADAVRHRLPVIQNALDVAAPGPGYPDGHVPLRRHIAVPILDGDLVRMVLGVGNKPSDYDGFDVQELQLIGHDIMSIVQRRRADVALAAAYEQMLASDERFAFAMEASAEGIWDWDLHTNVITYSSEFHRMLGFEPGTLGEGPEVWAALVHRDDIAHVSATTRAGLRSGVNTELECRVRVSDGSYRWMLGKGKAVAHDDTGRAVRAVGTLTDLTARKEVERALRSAKDQADEANRAKSAFLAVMSHEIRTPLNGVIGMAEVLSKSDLPASEADAVRIISTSASSLLALIDDILDFSKIEAGRLDLEVDDTVIENLIDGVCEALGPSAVRRHVELSVFIAPDVPPCIRTDATRLRQILYNLIGNAVKFSGGDRGARGHVRIRVQLAARDPLQLSLSVADNGIGMTAETRSRLFASFMQAEVSTTRRFGGTGLGLAICKRLVRLLGGEISVTSTLGEGSTFSVLLPTEASAVQPVLDLPDVSDVACILVHHEDAPGEAADLATFLRHRGARVTLASTVDEAEHLAAAWPPPVVLIERETEGGHVNALPSNDGLKRVRITRERRPRPPVVDPALVSLDRESLRQHSFLRAVAIAAGRAVPEITVEEAEPASGDHALAQISVVEARRQGRLILVAEDDEVNQKVIVRQLELLGYAADVAGDGAEAFRLWQEGNYALLLTDLRMPTMDGYSLAEAVRRAERERHDRIPIIALSANALRGEVLRAKAAGIDEYLTKPVQLKLLKQKLVHWLPPNGSRRTSGPTETVSVADAGAAPGGIDLAVLRRFVGDEPEIIREFMHSYRDSALRMAAEMRSAHAAGDFPRISGIAHKLKSPSRAVGAVALGEACAELERAADRGDHQAVAVLFPEFEGMFRLTQSALEMLLNEA